MKCPLLTMYTVRIVNTSGFSQRDCIEQECAWWDEEKNCCSLKVIAKELTKLQLKQEVTDG